MFKFLVDESGEAGIENIRGLNSGGASPYMTLGGCFIRSEYEEDFICLLNDIQAKFNKRELHCNRLKHEQKVFYAKQVALRKLKLFGVISKKSTLGRYKDDIENSSHKYYNKCAQYLLEKLGLFMEKNDINPADVEIIFEEGNFDYDALISLIALCQKNPMNPNSLHLRRIDICKITKLPKEEEPLLQIADLVAHALYRCVDKTEGNYSISEKRYLDELRTRFFHSEKDGKVDNFGIKSVHNVKQLQLDEDMCQFLTELNVN